MRCLRKCMYKDCERREDVDKNLKLFSWPVNLSRAIVWAENSGRPDIKERAERGYDHVKTCVLCSDHFVNDSDYANCWKQKLNPGAVPIHHEIAAKLRAEVKAEKGADPEELELQGSCTFLLDKEEETPESEETAPIDAEMTRAAKTSRIEGACMYVRCTNRTWLQRHLGFFTFPEHQERALKWVENCGRPDFKTFLQKGLSLTCHLVCEEHFVLDSDFVNPVLKDSLTETAVPVHYRQVAPKAAPAQVQTEVPIENTPHPSSSSCISTENVASIDYRVKFTHTTRKYQRLNRKRTKCDASASKITPLVDSETRKSTSCDLPDTVAVAESEVTSNIHQSDFNNKNHLLQSNKKHSGKKRPPPTSDILAVESKRARCEVQDGNTLRGTSRPEEHPSRPATEHPELRDEPLNMESMCRTCAKQKPVLIEIFGQVGWVRELLRAITGSKVLPNDGLPDKVCGECHGKLMDVVRIARQCREAEAELTAKFLLSKLEQQKTITQEKEASSFFSPEVSEEFSMDLPRCMAPLLSAVALEEDFIMDSSSPPAEPTIMESAAVENTISSPTPGTTASQPTLELPEAPLTPSQVSVGRGKDTTKPSIGRQPSKKTGKKPSSSQYRHKKLSKEMSDALDSAVSLRSLSVPSPLSRLSVFCCHACDSQYPFRSALLLLRHYKLRHGLAPLLCTQCYTCLETPEDLREHVATLHPECLPELDDTPPDKCKLGVTLEDFSKGRRSSINMAHLFPLRVRYPQGDKKAKLVCCGQTFRGKYELNKHEKRHRMRCKECQQDFTDIELYRKHKTEHQQSKFTGEVICELCGLSFKDKRCFMVHFSRKHADTLPADYKCRICDEKFKAKSSRNAHEVTHKKSTLCSECGVTFRNKDTLNYHMEIHKYGRRRYMECSVCFMFLAESRFEDHMLRHLSKQPFACPLCGKRFCHRSHVTTHLENQKCRVDCKICLLRFTSIVEFQTHRERHRLKGDVFVCPVCKEEFASEVCGSEPSAEATQLNSEPFCGSMKACGEPSLSGFIALEQHCAEKHLAPELLNSRPKDIESQTKEIHKFICKYCPTTFRDDTLLQIHSLDMHAKKIAQLDSTPALSEEAIRAILTCNFCNTVSKDVPEFITHRKTHPESSSKKCKYCDKRFRGRNNFRLHVRTMHTDVSDTRFPCDMCDKSFKTSQYLSMHKKRGHKLVNKFYSCDLCGKTFVFKSMVEFHMRYHTELELLESGIKLNSTRPRPARASHIDSSLWPFKCEECITSESSSSRGRYKTQERYLVHLVKVHKRTDIIFQCPYCEFSCTHPGRYHSHKFRVHESSQGDLACRHCGMRFKKEIVLLRHEASHGGGSGDPDLKVGARPFKCEACGRGFLLRRQLREHESKFCELRAG